jgi:hypothetical protein
MYVENNETTQQRIIEKRMYFKTPSGIQRINKSKETRKIKNIGKTSGWSLQKKFRWVKPEYNTCHLKSSN